MTRASVQKSDDEVGMPAGKSAVLDNKGTGTFSIALAASGPHVSVVLQGGALLALSTRHPLMESSTSLRHGSLATC